METDFTQTEDDAEQYNELLKDLGEDAYNTAYLPDEDETMGMGGI